jgi:hypothetical protein
VESTQLGAQLGCIETSLLANKAFLHRVAEFKDFIDADRPRRVALFTHPENFNVDYFRPICYSFLEKFSVIVDDFIGALTTCGAPNTGFLKAYYVELFENFRNLATKKSQSMHQIPVYTIYY